jgi:large subunit ribosomal protein L32
MPNPKRKHTPHRRDCRRSANSKIDIPNVGKCLNCSEPKMPHKICQKCGYYNGIYVLKKKTPKSLLEVNKK